MNSFVKNALIFCFAALIFVGCNSNKTGSNDGLGSPVPSQKPSKENNSQKTTAPPSKDKEEIEFKKVGVIREFGGVDNAALFGVLSKCGKFQISKVEGPAFLKSYSVGELNQTSISKLFLNTSKPLSIEERQNLISEFNGATVIYTENYSGNLCSDEEISYEIKASGRLNEANVEVIFQFQALPNSTGNCKFHVFGILTHYIN
ncbi:MAG: hypothetical protein ACXWRZ_02900 [Bdellovibrio sp.]